MGKISIYHRKFPGTKRKDIFIVREYANNRYYHHRQFTTMDAAERYAKDAIPKKPTQYRYEKITATASMQRILKSSNYAFPRRPARD